MAASKLASVFLGRSLKTVSNIGTNRQCMDIPVAFSNVSERFPPEGPSVGRPYLRRVCGVWGVDSRSTFLISAYIVAIYLLSFRVT
jgi:hypothetical protein